MSVSATHVGPHRPPSLHQTHSLIGATGAGLGYHRGIVKTLRLAASAVRAGGGAGGETDGTANVADAQHDDDVMYKKARVYMRSCHKRVLFKVNHHLYQTGDLEEDVRRLKNDQYQGVLPPASVIWGERFDQDVLQSSKALNEDNFWHFVHSVARNKFSLIRITEGALKANFWHFVHSVAWNKFSSIRITEGALLDSLLFVYYNLLQEGQLYSYVTQIYQNDISTGNRKDQDNDEKETTKIMFTYYAPSLTALSDVIFRHHGSRISIQALAAQNRESQLRFDAAAESPEIALDFAWSCDSTASRQTQPTPANPPNSPTPSLTPTQALLKKRLREQSLIGLGRRRSDLVKYPASYYNLPLVLRNRLSLGRKVNAGNDSMSVEGKSLRPDDTNQYARSSSVYFTRESPDKVSRYKSSYHGVRETLGKRFNELRLPTLTPSSPKKRDTPLVLGKHGDSPTPIRSCLASLTHLQTRNTDKHHMSNYTPASSRLDSKRQLVFSPNVEYINLVQRVTPGANSPTKPPGTCTFDTKKLFINWSLEKIRQARRRGKKKGKSRVKTADILKRLELQGTDKDYILGKFLADQSENSRMKATRTPVGDQCLLHSIKDFECDQCRREVTRDMTSPLPRITNHNEVRKLQFAALPTPERQADQSLSQSMPPGYADTVPDFKQGCYEATRHFIIRKEQMTTSKTFLTVTSLTINKIPSDRYMSWQYKTDDTIIDG